LFGCEHFGCELSDRNIATPDSLQVIELETGRIIDALTVFGQR